jgi:pimeloyl-ACP methyl ester carboxylesterase
MRHGNRAARGRDRDYSLAARILEKAEDEDCRMDAATQAKGVRDRVRGWRLDVTPVSRRAGCGSFAIGAVADARVRLEVCRFGGGASGSQVARGGASHETAVSKLTGEAGNDPQVVGLVYVAAFAPDTGESVGSVSEPYPPAPLGAELRPDAEGFLSISPKGFAEDFAQEVPAQERRVLWATQGPTNAAVFGTPISNAAWKTKPSWFVVADEDRAIPPALENAEAERMRATTINVTASHLVMISHPQEVADLIEKAATSVATH